MIKSAADFIMGVWTAPEVPLLIEYPLDIMEELRAQLCDELQRLSRGGGDVAGVLFGVSRGAAIRIMTWRAISRGPAEEHATRMSRHDRAEMVRVLGMAASDPAMQGFEPLGWFVSRTESGTGLTPAEIDLFENFFPNSWQVTLLLRRGPGGTARAGFFVREPDGSLRPDASYRELFVQPVRRVPGTSSPRSPLSAVAPQETLQRPVEPIGDVAPPIAVVPKAPPPIPAEEEQPRAAAWSSAVEIPVEQASTEISEEVAATEIEPLEPPPAPQRPVSSRPAPALAIVEPPKPVRAAAPAEKLLGERPPLENFSLDRPAVSDKPAFDKPPVDAPAPETPSFSLQTHSFGGARWLWIGLGLLALALVIYLFMQQRSGAAPVASFALRVASLGDSIEISWDRDSTPVWNGQRASVKIQDGPDTKQLSLSADQLRTGKTTYARETPDVAIEMTIYDTGNREYHEFARFIAPVPYAPTTAPVPQPHDASQLRTDRDNLAAEVQRLKEDVRKEAARADQAEDLVRILENRLKIDDGRSHSGTQSK